MRVCCWGPVPSSRGAIDRSSMRTDRVAVAVAAYCLCASPVTTPGFVWLVLCMCESCTTVAQSVLQCKSCSSCDKDCSVVTCRTLWLHVYDVSDRCGMILLLTLLHCSTVPSCHSGYTLPSWLDYSGCCTFSYTAAAVLVSRKDDRHTQMHSLCASMRVRNPCGLPQPLLALQGDVAAILCNSIDVRQVPRPKVMFAQRSRVSKSTHTRCDCSNLWQL